MQTSRKPIWTRRVWAKPSWKRQSSSKPMWKERTSSERTWRGQISWVPTSRMRSASPGIRSNWHYETTGLDFHSTLRHKDKQRSKSDDENRFHYFPTYWITTARRHTGREAASPLLGISTGHSVCGACAVFLAVLSWHCSLRHCGSRSVADPGGHLTPNSSSLRSFPSLLTPHPPRLSYLVARVIACGVCRDQR